MATFAANRPQSTEPRQVRSLADQVQKGYCDFRGSDTWAPAVNLYETEQAYLVCVDLSGVRKEEIDIEVVDSLLRFRGVRATPVWHPIERSSQHKPRVHLMEIDHGAFSRTVEMPQDIDRNRITAHYLDGLLWIEIPKRSQA